MGAILAGVVIGYILGTTVTLVAVMHGSEADDELDGGTDDDNA